MQDRTEIAAQVRTAADAGRTLAERHQAFGALVREFQDMAFGCAFAALGDQGAAEDAAQDAFITAWQRLPQIRDARAFPGWLRQIVLSQCHRQTRRKRIATVPLTDVVAVYAPTSEAPFPTAVRQAEAKRVQISLAALPETERLVTVLFYIADYSQSEIAAFTGLSPVSVRKRLASARSRLRERWITEMQEDLHAARPSRSDDFAGRVLAFTKLFSALVDQGVSLVRSLHQIAQQETDPAFRAAVDDINQQLQAGSTLSQAMQKYPRYFHEEYIQVIRAGETSGRLEVSLQRLADGTYTEAPVLPTTRTLSAVLSDSWRTAHTQGHASVQEEHFLLSLLQRENSIAVQLLARLGVALSPLRDAATEHLATLATGQATVGSSDAAMAAEYEADRESLRRSAPKTDTGDALLGLAIAAELLQHAGVNAAAIRTARETEEFRED